MDLSDVNSAGIVNREKVGPIFRIVDPYPKKDTTTPDTSNQSTSEEEVKSQDEKRRRGDLYADDTGLFWHKMSDPMITPPIIAENLPLQFNSLPIYGAPDCPAQLDEYEQKRIQEFVGSDLDKAELDELESYCNPDNLKTGKEIKMMTQVPVPGLISKNLVKEAYSDDDTSDTEDKDPEKELCILKRLKTRQQQDVNNSYPRCLKYRGVKLLPPREPEAGGSAPELEPGRELVYRVRVYRPFTFHLAGDKQVRGRHSVFSCDMLLLGRQPLTALRDRLVCRNDLDMRLDRSDDPDAPHTATAKEVFPSGFLFINNAFYVDGRAGCRDTAAGVAAWARARGLGAFPVRRMERWRLDRVPLKLAHPDVYVHQGACEHVFLFSELRLLSRRDPLQLGAWPRRSALSHNQTIYCTACAALGARWLVAGCARVPFDPAFSCEPCFRQYLYAGGRRLGAFRAYAYRGNELGPPPGNAARD